MILELPYKFDPYPWQKEILRKYFVDDIKHHLYIIHRRSGKTRLAMNIITGSAFRKRGAYFFLLPQQNQARKSVWENRGDDDVLFIDQVPPQLIKKVNNSEMAITYSNKSILRLLGSDRYNNLMGANPRAFVYDEYSLQNPLARDYLLPIIAKNGGSEILICTPRGHNHAYKLYQTVKDLDNWNVQLLTVEDTRDNNGNPLVTQEAIEDLRIAGWSDDRINQEFYCSFDSSVPGAYFSDELKKAYSENRVYDFALDVTKPVYTFWDLGYADATAIWFAQQAKDFIRIIGYYEANMKDIPHYINEVEKFRAKYNLTFAKHFAPHDGRKHDHFTGKSLIERCRELGFIFETLPRINNKDRLIQMAKGPMNRMHFHETNCEQGLAALKEYHAEYIQVRNVFSKQPVHNWASHGADAFQYMAQAFLEDRINPAFSGRIFQNRVNMGSIFQD